MNMFEYARANDVADADFDIMGKLLLVVRNIENARFHPFQDGRRAYQAANVRRKNAIGAAVH